MVLEDGTILGKRGTPLKPWLQNGYNKVYYDGKKQYVHRLVALEFVPNPNNYSYVNHIDGNRTNNNADNLEWCTHQQNHFHAGRILHSKGNMAVIGTREGEVLYFPSQTEAAEVTGAIQSHISAVIRGKRKTAGGYVWKYGMQI